MSGHSKWSTIKRQKGAADAKRGQVFTKLSNAITVAVRQGSGIVDPASNFKLRLCIEKARAANMPKENIERAISKGAGAGAIDVSELLYEGFGPGGVAIIIEAVTDNKQRTVSDVKNILEKNGGTLGAPGSVSYLFKKRGEFAVKVDTHNSEDLLSKGLNAGAEDVEEIDSEMLFYVDPANFQNAKKSLEEQGIVPIRADLVWLADTEISLDEAKSEQVMNLVEKLSDLDDVQEVYTNLA